MFKWLPITNLFIAKKRRRRKRESEIKNITENENDEYENDDLDDLLTDEEEDWTKSECDCIMCQIVNDIDNFWNNWTPEVPLEKALKKNIDEMQF